MRTEHATVAGSARALGVDWHTLWAAIRPRLQDLPTMLTGKVDLTRDADGHVRARLLDLVPGRTGKTYADWLTERSAQVTDEVRRRASSKTPRATAATPATRATGPIAAPMSHEKGSSWSHPVTPLSLPT